jgi:inhibitor of KinA sporulation pathway (predicted exonuclease)
MSEDSDQKGFKPLEIFTALDLEMNQTETASKIIQIGAVVGNITTGKILDTLSVFVNPDERLNPRIIELTGIQQRDVDRGMSLGEGYFKLKRFHENYFSFINTVVWGGGDSQELRNQLVAENPGFTDWCFGRRWIDAKTIYVSLRIANGKTIQGGLKNACKKLGVTFSGPAHRADNDAANTFKIYCRLLDILKTKSWDQLGRPLVPIQSKDGDLALKTKV